MPAKQLARLPTELRKSLCTWFGEVCSCCCSSLLPQLACNILATTYKDFFFALYILIRSSSLCSTGRGGRREGCFGPNPSVESSKYFGVTLPFLERLMSLLELDESSDARADGASPVFPFLSLGLFKTMIILTSSMISVVIHCDDSLSSRREASARQTDVRSTVFVQPR